LITKSSTSGSSTASDDCAEDPPFSSWPKIAEGPIFISPWDADAARKPEPRHASPATPAAAHPFARRTKSRNFVEPKHLFSSASTDSSDDPAKFVPDVWDESFEEILRTANRSIETAESILSTLCRGDDADRSDRFPAPTHDSQGPILRNGISAVMVAGKYCG
jgi:hypothetical protein